MSYPHLEPGAIVVVKPEWPEHLERCHIRTPSYVRGRKGIVCRFLGSFANPEDLAFRRPAEPRRLYHVEFQAAELWPSDPKATGIVMVELYEHWLLDAEEISDA